MAVVEVVELEQLVTLVVVAADSFRLELLEHNRKPLRVNRIL
jgi:hypothetical protein